MVGEAEARHQAMCTWYGGLIVLGVLLPVFGQVPRPRNVKMESVNFKNVLWWDRPKAPHGNLTYTAQYKVNTRDSSYRNGCQSTKQTHCDFSWVRFDSLFQVRSESNGSVSTWVNITFDPYMQTVIGAPKVNVTSRAGFLDVSIVGPIREYDNVTLKSIYGKLLYKILYWKQSSPLEIKTMETEQNLATLEDLAKWTNYCIKVQAIAPEFNQNDGQFSQVVCENSHEDSRTDAWKIAAVFILCMLIAAGVIIGLFYMIKNLYKVTRFVFYPAYSFPQHLKEYLNKPFYSTPHLPTLPSDECVESCQQLTFISEENEQWNEKEQKLTVT
ncbi:interleukin-10 receptor subunit beta-like [Discoglossus pictus]